MSKLKRNYIARATLKWNSCADENNQWNALSEDEKEDLIVLEEKDFFEKLYALISKSDAMMKNHRLFQGICDEEIEFERAVDAIREFIKD